VLEAHLTAEFDQASADQLIAHALPVFEVTIVTAPDPTQNESD